MATKTKTKPAAKKRSAPKRSSKPKERTFHAARNDNLRVVVKASRPKYITDQGGNVVDTQIVPGKYAQFENHRFSTDDPEIIEHLRQHSSFGSTWGWYEDYDASREPTQDLIARIQDLAIQGDKEAIRELADDERDSGGGGRDQVLAQADRALLSLGEITGDSVPKSRKKAAKEEPRGSAVTSENEPIPFATKAAEKRAEDLQIKPQALRERFGNPSSEKGYTVEDVEATARSEGGLQEEPDEPDENPSVDPRTE